MGPNCANWNSIHHERSEITRWDKCYTINAPALHDPAGIPVWNHMDSLHGISQRPRVLVQFCPSHRSRNGNVAFLAAPQYRVVEYGQRLEWEQGWLWFTFWRA